MLRGIEEEGAKRRAAEIVVYAATPIALYILNHKRDRLGEIEARYGMRVLCLGDDAQMASQFRIERVRAQVPGEVSAAITQDVAMPPLPVIDAEVEEIDEVTVVAEDEDEEEAEEANDAVRAEAGETPEEAERRHRRRRRRRRGGRREDTAPVLAAEPAAADEPASAEASVAEAVEMHVEGVPEHAEAGEDEHRGRRRGRRGGRRRRHEGDGEIPPHAAPGADQPELPPVYTGPTPANPFGGQAFDIFDVMDQVETAEPVPAAAASPAETSAVPEPVAGLEPENSPLPEDAAPLPAAVIEAPTAESEPAPAAMEAPDAGPQPTPPEPAAVEPVPLVAANDVIAEPAVKPIIVGASEASIAEKKRGWWRR